jgi:hypothetical protein
MQRNYNEDSKEYFVNADIKGYMEVYPDKQNPDREKSYESFSH